MLSVVFKGKPTHHLVSTNEEGQLQVNKKTFGGHTSIESLVTALGTKQPGWPVALNNPLVNHAAAAGGDTNDTAAAQLPVAAKAELKAMFEGDGGNTEAKLTQPTRAALRRLLTLGAEAIQSAVQDAGLMQYFDTDGDGTLSLAEALA